MRANARLGRIAVAGAVAAAPFGYLFLKVWGASRPHLPRRRRLRASRRRSTCVSRIREMHQAKQRPDVGPRGRIPELTGPAIGAAGMRAASGFLLFLLAISLRDAGEPVWWFGVLAAAGVLGGFVADLFAPRLPTNTREEAVVVACVSAGAIGALLAFEVFGLPLLHGLRVRRRSGLRAQPAGVPEPDATQRARGCAGTGVRPLRGGVPAGVGGRRVHPRAAADRLPAGHLDPGGLLHPHGRGVLWHTRRRSGPGTPSPEAGIA